MKVESIADRAGRHIQEWIITGRFKPGGQIKEESISQLQEISRPPVRETLKMLEATGWINTRTHLGHSAAIMTASGKSARKFIREANVGNVAVIPGLPSPVYFFHWDREENRL